MAANHIKHTHNLNHVTLIHLHPICTPVKANMKKMSLHNQLGIIIIESEEIRVVSYT